MALCNSEKTIAYQFGYMVFAIILDRVYNLRLYPKRF